MLWSSACRPHDCTHGTVYVLFDPSHDIAYGAVRSDLNDYVFGKPSSTQEALLLILIARSLVADEAFPLDTPNALRVKKIIRDSGGSIEGVIAIGIGMYE